MDLSPSLVDPVFVEQYHAHQHFDDGIVFPKIFSPRSAHSSSVAAFVRGLTSNSEWLQEELHRHSAVLFRGFSVQTADDFAAVSQAFGWEPMKYNGGAIRHKVLSGIYTANEGPLEKEIWLHHEMAQSAVFPSKIVFFCEIEPTKNGETLIVLSHKVAEQIQVQFPTFVKQLENDGLLYTVCLKSHDDPSSVVGKGWPSLFDTNDEVEVEKRVASCWGRIDWLPNKTAKLTQGPMPAVRSFREDGRKVWFNNIVRAYKPGGESVRYGDGSELEAKAVDGCQRILEDLVVEIPWTQGDVLVLDNLAVLHGRRAAKPPRRILVALFK